MAEPTPAPRPADPSPPSGFVAANLVLRFLLELGALGGLAYAGAVVGDGLVAKLALGVGMPLAAGVLWGLFVSPKATVAAPWPVRMLVEAAVFISAGVWLIIAGRIALGVLLMVLWLLNRLALFATGRRGPIGG